MQDKDLEFSALMENLGGEDLVTQLQAAALDEAKPGDDTAMVMGHIATIGQLRELRDAIGHIMEHQCEWAATILIKWAMISVERVHPFLEWLDSGGWADLGPDEEGHDGPDGSVQRGDEGGVELEDEGDDVQD